MAQKEYQLSYLANFLSAKLVGDGNITIFGIGSLSNAKGGEISFLQDTKLSQHLATTRASAVIIRTEDLSSNSSGNFIVVNNPYLAYAKISALFDDLPEVTPGIHPTAILAEDCQIGEKVYVGPYVVIGKRVKIASGVRIEAGCVVGDDVSIGENTRLAAKVVLYHKVIIGSSVLIHSGTIIGSDGFGNANDRGVWHKIYQLGKVIIGNQVEIGANTTIDRGAIEDTIISDGVKIDNQVQIGHNVHIGAHTAIAGCVGIAGSTKIGKYCMIGGRVGITGHIEIADRVVITGMSSVGKSITEPGGIYASAIPAVPHLTWWRAVTRLMQLEKIIDRLKKLEKKLV